MRMGFSRVHDFESIFNNFDSVKTNANIDLLQNVPLIDAKTKKQSFVNIVQTLNKRNAIPVYCGHDGVYRCKN